jgi:hypothetical protein
MIDIKPTFVVGPRGGLTRRWAAYVDGAALVNARGGVLRFSTKKSAKLCADRYVERHSKKGN